MSTVTGTPLPSLSQVQVWPTAHLEAARAYWTGVAQAWDDSFTAVYRQAPAPGGVPWDGLAADVAIQRVGADRLMVLGAVDRLNTAAALARNGITELHTARRLALQAVADAQQAGFTVGEDLSVTDRTSGGAPAMRSARLAQALRLTGVIRSRAAELVAIDQDVAARITNVATGLNAIQFDESPAMPCCPMKGRGAVPLGSVVVCEPYAAGGGFMCFEWSLDGSAASGWSRIDVSGGYP